MTNKVRNANSAPPGSAGGQTTVTSGGGSGGLPETGPLPRSALTQALLTTLGRQAPTSSTTQGTPAVAAGQVPPATQDEPADQPETNEVQPTTEGETTELETPPGETQETTLEPGTEEAPESSATETTETVETTENTEGGEPADQVPIGVQKRINKLTAQLRELQAKLAGQSTQAPPADQAAPRSQGPGPVDTVTDPVELDRREEIAGSALVEIDNLLARLPVQPQLVERELRKLGLKLTDNDGQEDFSTESMMNWLTGNRHVFHNVLRAIPRRREYLVKYSQEHASAVQQFPWLGQQADQRNALMVSFLSQAPAMRQSPNHEYWLACAIEKHLELESKRPGNGNRTAPAAARAIAKPKQVRSTPNTATAPAAAPRGRVDKVAAARQKVLKEGSRGALSEFLQATNYAQR